MRVLGWISFALGVLFVVPGLILLVGGDDLSRRVTGAVMLLGSARLIVVGRALAGIRRTKRASSASVAVPVTPVLVALIGEILARERRTVVRTIGIGVAAWLVLATGASLTMSHPSAAVGFVVTSSVIALAVGGVVGGLWLALAERPVRRDLRESTCLRASGALRLRGRTLHIPGESFVVPRPVATALAGVDRGTVDYTRHARVVLEVRDGGGTPVYRLPGYAPADVTIP